MGLHRILAEDKTLFFRNEEEMKPKVFAIIGSVMLAVAAIFFFYAINHPTLSFPWSLNTTHTIYAVYLIVIGIAFLLAIILKIIKTIKK